MCKANRKTIVSGLNLINSIFYVFLMYKYPKQKKNILSSAMLVNFDLPPYKIKNKNKVVIFFKIK